jgi:hypothetical protein
MENIYTPRAQVESEAQTLATICSQAITVLKTELNASKYAKKPRRAFI